MNQEFKSIFDLCYFVAKTHITNNNAVKASLIKACLETLYAFLSWIPLFYIFSNNFIQEILISLVDQQNLRILALKCLTEIAQIKLDNYSPEDQQLAKPQLLFMFQAFLIKLQNIMPVEISLLNERNKVMRTNSKQVVGFDNLCQVGEKEKTFFIRFEINNLNFTIEATLFISDHLPQHSP